MAKKIALGRGIASLLGSSHLAEEENFEKNIIEEMKKTAPDSKVGSPVSNNVIINEPLLIDVSQIKANPNQPRKIFREKELEELSLSIKENGVLQPILVTKIDKGFEIIAGERRLKATKLAGLDKIPAIVKQTTDKEKLVFAILENVQREDLNCVEEALAYFQLMEDFHLTQEEVAKKIGKERSTIANFLRILKLPRPVIELVQKDLLSFGHAKVLASVQEREKAIRSANIVIEKGMSVRELEKLLKSKILSDATPKKNNFFDEKLDALKQSLEKKRGYHFNMKSMKDGSGEFKIKFSDEAEFNDIYEFLMK